MLMYTHTRTQVVEVVEFCVPQFLIFSLIYVIQSHSSRLLVAEQ